MKNILFVTGTLTGGFLTEGPIEKLKAKQRIAAAAKPEKKKEPVGEDKFYAFLKSCGI